MNKALLHLGMCLLLLVTAVMCGCRSPTGIPLVMPAEQFYGDYLVRITEDEEAEESYLAIFHRGARVFERTGHRFVVGSVYEEAKTNNFLTIGRDITGDGKPDLVVSEWSGGMHCCFAFHVFEIGDTFRFVQTINAEHTDDTDFLNMDSDPALEFPMFDWTFAYWRTCYAGSPSPKVILKYKDGRYRMEPGLMRKPPMGDADLKKLAGEIGAVWGKDGYGNPPEPLWAAMLDLIYSGNMPQAWLLIDLAWPTGMAGKGAFLENFKVQLSRSPFWNEVRDMNAVK